MIIEQFLGENCILEKLSGNYSDNQELLAHLLQAIKNIKINDAPKLKNYKDYSFKASSDNNRQIACQAFKKFQQQIEQWPDDIQSALLAIATLNWNGYIRQQAFKRLATYRRRFFCMPFLLNGCLDPIINVKNEAENALYRLNNELAKSCPNELLILDKITKETWFPQRLRCIFAIAYLKIAGLNERCEYLTSLEDSEKASFLWKKFSYTYDLSARFKKFNHAGLFYLGQRSKFFRVYCESFIYMPLELLPQYAQIILRLPRVYLRLFLINALQQLENRELTDVDWDFFIACSLHKDAKVNHLASTALRYRSH